jgi:CoA:oxalate CoA-transferase
MTTSTEMGPNRRGVASLSPSMPSFLSGVRVIDFTHVLAGPTAGMILADLGAEVIHVEPLEGDVARQYGPYLGGVHPDHSTYFLSLNRGKKSLAVDLRQESDKEILRRLVCLSDVLIENYRPGALDRLGFGWEAVQALNPRLVYASISGFGHDTLPEYANRPAYDLVAQAYSGFMSITGPEGGEPCRAGSSIGDLLAGHQAVIGILAALLERQSSDRGQRYDGSMVDGLFSVLENAVVRYTAVGEVPCPLGTAHPSITPFQAFPTRDGWIVTPIGSQKLWEGFCRVLGREDLLEDPRFADNYLRTQHRRELAEILSAEFPKRSTGEWLEMLEGADVPCAPVHTVAEVCEDPHIAYREMLVEVDHPGVGPLRIVGSPLRLSETPGYVRGPAPRLGQHTEEILRDLLGFPEEEVVALREQGVVR